MGERFKADVIVVGAGLAGMVAAHEAVLRGRRVLLLDQEGPQSLGGQAYWSLGGLFMVATPEQRRMGIRDSAELAYRDWMGSAQFDRAEDANPRKPRGRVHRLGGGRHARMAAPDRPALVPGRRLGRARRGRGPATATPSRAFTSPGAPAPAS